MKQLLKDAIATTKELGGLALGLGMWVGGAYLAASLVEELGIKKEYAPYFIILQFVFVGIALNHFFGVKEKQDETK